MAKTSILDYSATPAENQDVNGISILGTARPSNMDDGLRAVMSHAAKGAVSRRVAKSAPYTVTKEDHNQVFDFTADATCTTQAAATLSDGWMCYIYASGGDVTINPNGSETVNGEETATVKEGNFAILRVYDGNFLLNFFLGSGAGDIIHEEKETTLSSGASRDITGIDTNYRAFTIEGSLTSITSNPGITGFQLSIGDGATWHDISNSAPLVRWSNGGTTNRYFFAELHNLDNADLPLFFKSDTQNEINTTFKEFVTPSVYPARPITALRFRIVPPSGSLTLNIGCLRVRGIR